MNGAGKLLSAVASRAARRPLLALASLGAVGVIAAVMALSLRPTAATSTLVGRSSAMYKATQRFYAGFGEEPVEVLVKGDLRKLLLSSDIDRLAGLEGCLSGNLPPAAFASEGGAAGPCAQLARLHSVKVVLGPGTFVNEAALQIDNMLSAGRAQAQREAKAARNAVYRAALARGLGHTQANTLAAQAAKATLAGYAAEVSALAIRYGITSPPSIDDHEFVSTLVFESSKPAGTPKQRFASLFPGRDAALVSVRLKAHLSAVAHARTVGLIRAAVAMPQWHLQNGESYLLTGEPLIASELERSISHAIELLLVAVLIVMGVILSLVFDARPRLLPLAVALLAAALAFGALSAVGASLTMASVAVLPVLVGLAVDYAIQFQSRIAEALAGERDPDARDARMRAIGAATAGGAPAVATAALATVTGLLVLLLSPVPMVRGFAVLLVVGVVLAFASALLVCSSALALGRRRQHLAAYGAPAGGRARRLPGAFGGLRTGVTGLRPRLAGSPLLAALGVAWQGAREIVADNALTRGIGRLGLGYAVQRPGRVLGVGLALAVLGWGLGSRTPVQTDIAKLAPRNLQSLESLNALERSSGVGGEIDMTVSSRSLTKPSTIAWMSSYENAVLSRFGYTAASGCSHSQVCPAFSLPDLFQASEGGVGKLRQAQVDGLLRAIPPYFAQAVIAPDHRTAVLSFGIRLMPLTEQQHVIEQMRASLHPPAGVQAQLVGLSVLAAQSAAQVASPWQRTGMLLAALLAVALVLVAAFRGDLRRALVPLVPVALATGWSALALFATTVPLNPMSVTLGALVIAISTEFSVLLSERHRQEMLAGHSANEALRRAYRHTGAAVVASGVTAIAGFGVLALSDIAMLRDFGLVTLVDLSVSLAGVLVALPAALTLAEGRERGWARATRATSPSLG